MMAFHLINLRLIMSIFDDIIMTYREKSVAFLFYQVIKTESIGLF